MSGFSAEWLALREPADHHARNAAILKRLVDKFAHQPRIDILDLGCGTGSNLRAMAPAFPPGVAQHWNLVDHDHALLAEARRSLSLWADDAREEGGRLVLEKAGRIAIVAFTQANLANAEAIDIPRGGVVTAAAFFDLVSPEWIAAFARIAASAEAVYAVLTYDGREVWSPPHPADAAMLAAFHAHQRRDKGFGKAAGPRAAQLLADGLHATGFAVELGESAWRLDGEDRALMEKLAESSAVAISELGYFDPEAVADWLESRRRAQSCLIGHLDCLALRS